MNTQWRKIAGDFRAHRWQITLIGIVLATGAAVVVASLNAHEILQREIAHSYRSANPSNISLWFDKVEPALIEKVQSVNGVTAVDTKRVVFTRIAGRNNKWILVRLTVLRDFADQRLGKVHQHGAEWPSNNNGIFIEQSGRALLGAAIGDDLHLRTPSGEVATVVLAGFVHDTTVAPSTQDRVLYGYVTAAAIGQSAEFDQLLVRTTAPYDFSETNSFAHDLRDWMKEHGENPLRVDPLPNEHPHAPLMATMLRVLQLFAVIAFTCSAGLSLYMVSLWMKREVRQVGVMKTIGARTHQLAAQYLGLVAPLVLAANAIALPLGLWLGRSLVAYYQTSFNIDIADWGISRTLFGRELLFTLGIPFLAMAVPIVRAARMTPRAAIHDPGIAAPGSAGLSLTRWLKMPGNRRWTFALRNTFRRPGRLTITLVGLSAGGALLLTADNTYESLMRVVDVSLGNQGHDIQVQLQRPASGAELVAVAKQIPEIEIAEGWRTAVVTAGLTNGSESPRIPLFGYPLETRLLRLPVVEGRLPRSDELTAVVLNRAAQNNIDNAQPGQEVELHFRDRQTKVRVVGVVEEIGPPAIYTAQPTFEEITNLGDVASLLRVKMIPDAPDSTANALDRALLDAHLVAGNIQTREDVRNSLEEHFAVVTDVMRMVAMAAALLGAISLAASVGLNVLERAREIGVVRALGATPRAVRAMFLLESGAVAFISAIISMIAGIVLSRGLNSMASRDLLHVVVPLHISLTGIATLGGGLVIVLVAVWVFLGRMLRISVRDALAYE